MLFSKKQAHRNILAVTFTNKACEEMKSRIVEDMYKITQNKGDDRINEIIEFTKLPKAKILKQAEQIFQDILHDYSFFSVSTIDSFFQKIVRNFTRETGIQYNYEIELDKTSIVNKAVDDMLERSENDKELKKDIIALVEQNMDASAKWDFRSNLKKFMKDVIESDYRNYQEEYNTLFSDKKELSKFKKDLKDIQSSFIADLTLFETQMSSVLQKYNLSIEDFSGGTTRSVINKLLQTSSKTDDNSIKLETHFNNYDILEKWLTKANIDKEPLLTATMQLIAIAEKLKSYFEKNSKDYFTAKTIGKQLNYTALIDKALQIIRENLHESKKFLISEVPVFLAEIANQNSSSFIYEKTGTFYESYLIDEFQDTSRLQWDSFKPLLSDSLASSDDTKLNIIVGDLKQSIYSWRGGDWRLLATDVKKEFANYIEEIPLEDNWRSGENIVNFNNNFFKSSSAVLQDSIISKIPKHLHSTTGELISKSIYNNITQKKQKNFESFTEVNLYESGKHSDIKVRKQIVLNMIKQIEDLQLNNHQPGEIMILVRKNSEGSFIAEEIIKYAQSIQAKTGVNYDVISSDALFISSNKAIQLVISCLKYLTNKNNLLAFTEAAYLYYLQTNIFTSQDIQFNKEDFNIKLKNLLVEIEESYKFKLLHEIIDTIVLKLELNKYKENIPFLNSFRDLVHEFGLTNTSTSEYFLEYWEEKGNQQNLKIPENQNAINIISIHKSKGLAADFAFIPFCNWTFQSNFSDIEWVRSNIKPFDKLPIWPVNSSAQLVKTHFADQYYQKSFNEIIESFNMMYVAFTRARKGLYISAELTIDKNLKHVGTLLEKSMENIYLSQENKLVLAENDGFRTYSYGTITPRTKEDISHNYINNYDIFIPDKHIKIRPFYEKDKVDSNTTNHIKEGIIYHKLFENIIHINDCDKAVSNLLYQGDIELEIADKLKTNIKNILNKDFIKSWFNGSYKITNEAEIVSKDGQLRRPDRIMEKDNEVIIVDYKFGNLEKSQYIRQTKEYGNLLLDMGYKNIKTYIWFVLMDYLLEVDIKTGSTKKIILE